MDREISLYDTVVRRKDRKWFRIVELSEGGSKIGLKPSECADVVCGRKLRKIYVTPEKLARNYILMDYPPVKTYVDKSLIEKTDPEDEELKKYADREAYAFRSEGVHKIKRRHKK